MSVEVLLGFVVEKLPDIHQKLNEEAGYKRGRNSPIFRDLIACDNG